KQADEVVMIDLTPQALLNRLARGVIYGPERAQAALQNFFQESTLVALRELAMRQAAHAVESRLSLDRPDEPTLLNQEEKTERRWLIIGADPSTAGLIRRGRRVADYLRADCLAVYVSSAPNFGNVTADEREHVERHLNFARGLQIETRVLEGRDVADTVV